MTDKPLGRVSCSSRPRDPCFARALLYSLLVTSTLTAKVVHLCSHIQSLPVLLYVLYLPTFFLPDFVVVVGGYLLLHPGRYSRVRGTAAALITLVTFIAASAQIAFYLETGGEIRWSAAANFAHDPAGLKLLGSGSLFAGFTAFFILVLARLTTPILYKSTGCILLGLWTLCRSKTDVLGRASLRRDIEFNRDTLPSCCWEDIEEHERLLSQHAPAEELQTKIPMPASSVTPYRPLWLRRILAIIPIFIVCLLRFVRPGHSPYGHMSGTLPFTLRQMFVTGKADFCSSGHLSHQAPFPFPNVLANGQWDPPSGPHHIWRPSEQSSATNETYETLGYFRAKWLPDNGFAGFERWYNPETAEDMDRIESCPQCQFYDPAVDPMKISNLQEPILAPLLEALKKNPVLIKHVVLFHLESTRKDMFPLHEDSHLYQVIEKRMNPDQDSTYLKEELKKMSGNARFVTGELNSTAESNNLEDLKPWQRQILSGQGGINIEGAITGGTLTAKSLIESHCGAEALPVDFTEEADLTIYQPCLPHILNLFNRNKLRGLDAQQESTPNASREAVLAQPWRSVFAQSVTDTFDRQGKLNVDMGFNDTITRSLLLDPSAQHYPPDLPENNYFGFPDPVLKPYLQDLFQDAEQDGKRVFLSHLTSTTHHPWNLPESAGPSIPFLKPGRWGRERMFNRYLNTIKYADGWIGQFMDMLHEVGVGNETLVVFLGDHGMAFRHDSKQLTAFENPHISNFQVPLTFYHAQLPRIQLSVPTAKPRSILPTILDLLIHTGSINEPDTAAASSLLPQYQGQSLIRPVHAKLSNDSREAWAISVVNAGGALLSIASAAVPYRLVIPLCKAATFRFTNLATDPYEKSPLEFWTFEELLAHIEITRSGGGHDAAMWTRNAHAVGMWWAQEQKRLWRYTGAGSQDDKDPRRLGEVGKFKHEHWWNT